jgi:hypothetical protein
MAALLAVLWLPLPGWAAEHDWDSDWEEDWDTAEAPSPWQKVSGFAELASGIRLQDDATGLPRQSLNEARMRLESGYQGEAFSAELRAELRYDDLVEGWQLELREASLALSPSPDTDLKLGRQVLTWGTGDLLFLNDLFPKDWQAFFAGLDDEYLKAPANAAKLSYFGLNQTLDLNANLDLVWIPRFEADNYLTGERFSFFSPQSGTLVAPAISVDEPDQDALAARLYGNIDSLEWALYGYWGYSGQPLDNRNQPDFARLDSYGASIRLPLGPGLFNVESAWYDYRDQSGSVAGLPSDKLMLLVGYQQELASRLTLGLQYQLEHHIDYEDWRAAQPAPEYAVERNRHLTTVRFDYRALQERLQLSVFMFYSPSDEDGYLRPQARYRLDDHWSFAAGLNLFSGRHYHSFFAQLEDNSNGWARMRYSF